MASPFTGIDPYLEHPELWPELHHWLIIAIAQSLSPQIRPKYRVAVETRMYDNSEEAPLLVGIPDVTIKQSSQTSQITNVAVVEPITKPQKVTVPMPTTVKQGYLEIREVSTGEVVTAIEILSPVNKHPGEGRKSYINKRLKVLGSSTNLIEIDLLRNWEAMPILDYHLSSDYRILVSRSELRPEADLYAFKVLEKIPSLPLPLKPEDQEF